jgi:hypothetical protein
VGLKESVACYAFLMSFSVRARYISICFGIVLAITVYMLSLMRYGLFANMKDQSEKRLATLACPLTAPQEEEEEIYFISCGGVY